MQIVIDGQEVDLGAPGKKSAKLNADKVRQIRALLAEGYSLAQLARAFKVTPATINNVKIGLTWQHVR